MRNRPATRAWIAARPASPATTALSDVDAVHFLSPTVGWASADDQSRLFMTTDGGRRWSNVSPPLLRRSGRALAGGLAGRHS